MPTDEPIFPNEELINLYPIQVPTVAVTSSGCTSPNNALDNDPATFAQFPLFGYPIPPQLKTVLITDPLATSLTTPSDFGSLVSIGCIGGGNGGFNSDTAGGGGGGGAYAEVNSLPGISAGVVYNVQIGTQTAISPAFSIPTWFKDASTVLAKSGDNAETTPGLGGKGGQASTSIGTKKFSGGDGAFLAGGGGAAGPHGPGSSASGLSGGTGDAGLGGSGGSAGMSGSAGTEVDDIHGSGGGGGAFVSGPGGPGGGLYGGGGGGGNSLANQSVGGTGLIIFTYLTPAPSVRYLRADWGFDALICRVRLKQEYPGGGLSTTGLDFESSLGYLEGARPPPDIPFAVYVPYPVDGNVHELVVDPPVYARGIVVFPDAYAPTGSLPEVDLYQLQVYQSAEGVNDMPQTGPNPTTQWATVGVQVISIYPWAAGMSYSTLPAASLCSLYGLQTFGISEGSKAAIVTGGETVFDLEGFETAREIKIKITNELVDMRYFYLTMNGTLVVDPADSNGPEVQYWNQGSASILSERTNYITVVAQGINGDPTKLFVFPKMKIDGNFSFDMSKDKVTDVDMEYRSFLDKTWIRQDGQLGSAMESMYANGALALHS